VQWTAAVAGSHSCRACSSYPTFQFVLSQLLT
jgi:hypothetical protein